MTSRLFLATTITTALAVVFCPDATALESTASNHAMDSLSGFDTKIESYQALLTAALNELTHRIDACTATGKLYGPTHPDKDVNGCVLSVTSSTVPDPTTCDAGQPLVSNGTTWTCPKIFASPTVSGARVRAAAASGARYCTEHGYAAVYASASGGAGCHSCQYSEWMGPSWSTYSGCDGCAPYNTLTCF